MDTENSLPPLDSMGHSWDYTVIHHPVSSTTSIPGILFSEYESFGSYLLQPRRLPLSNTRQQLRPDLLSLISRQWKSIEAMPTATTIIDRSYREKVGIIMKSRLQEHPASDTRVLKKVAISRTGTGTRRT
ncbi:hypothetical protein QBC35DRAFT_509751 [Podospora australis]|uniref:Uncharacterized protein n=1 Tax=Podospora australis TaxID=1536484 RepID=A0AAN6WI66_9PEZI|nr:hypothetical protein QBC35DRAFT_509751 [Podospora australis]